jgi:hypothetical protein
LGVEQGRQVWSNSGFGIEWAAVEWAAVEWAAVEWAAVEWAAVECAAVEGLEAFGGYAIVIDAVPVAPSPIVMLDSSESAIIGRLEPLQFYQNPTARLALL